MREKLQLKIYLALAVCWFSSRAFAAEEKAEFVEPEVSMERRFIEGNIAISEWFDGVAEGLDLFLAGQRLTKKKNETSVKIENTTFSREYEQVQNFTSLNVNLRLPNVEEYWQLKFTSYDETKEKRGAQRGNLQKAPRERDYGASVGLFQKLGAVRMVFQPRFALASKLKVSHSLAFESVADMKDYEVNPKFEFFGNPDDGAGIFLACNINFQLSKIYSLTLINDGEYISRLRTFSTNNGFSIGQVRTKTTSISYNLIFSSNNRENYHLESYNLSATWSHLLYRNILHYNLGPNLDFSRSNGFRALPGAFITVALNF